MPIMSKVHLTLTFKSGLVIKYYNAQSCTLGEHFVDVFTPKPDKLTLTVYSYNIEHVSMVEIECI